MNNYRPRRHICNKQRVILTTHHHRRRKAEVLRQSLHHRIVYTAITQQHIATCVCRMSHSHPLCVIFTKHTPLLCAYNIWHKHTKYKPVTICCSSEEWKGNNRCNLDCILTAVWFTMENKSSGPPWREKKKREYIVIYLFRNTQL